MLIVALGWSLLEAILKHKKEHIMETDGPLTTCYHWGSAINKTFIKLYIHTVGGVRGAQYQP